MSVIAICTNHVPGGWEPEELETGIGGSEETIIQFSAELKKQYPDKIIYVFRTPKTNLMAHEYKGCVYLPREAFDLNVIKPDLTIFWKEAAPNYPLPYIHWSSDVERPWELGDNCKCFISLTNYHKKRNFWVNEDKHSVIPHGTDIKGLDKNKTEKKENLILYCSSPDRGLERLLEDWPKIRQNGNYELMITYGMDNIINFGGGRKRAYELECKMRQEGISYLGKVSKDKMEELYWRAKYWSLPLNNPDSELFCLNAVKTQYCSTIPIVNLIGALQNTVQYYVPYTSFYNNYLDQIKNGSYTTEILSWEFIIKNFWSKYI
jgi:hypothetical protein